MSFVAGNRSGLEQGSFTQWQGQACAEITRFDELPPFLLNVVSPYDLWMYVSSFGGLTAGRENADHTVFPYQTEDDLHEAHHSVGPTTLIWVDREETSRCWEPFERLGVPNDFVQRSLLKNLIGNQLIFREFQTELELEFAYRWTATEQFGFVRTASITNRGKQSRQLQLLDGMRHILPWGISQEMYRRLSCLTRAYTRVESDAQSGLAVYSQTSGIVDDAHPCEMLRANVCWQQGLSKPRISFDDRCLTPFRRQATIEAQQMLAGRRVGFFAAPAAFRLEPGESQVWHFVLDCGLSHSDVVALRERLLGATDLGGDIEQDITRAEKDLVRLVATADGLQESADHATTVHHFANVLFNSLRGGCITENYEVRRDDFLSFVARRNHQLREHYDALLSVLSDPIRIDDLLSALQQTQDVDLLRLGYEFLPLSHGRRHGDPSRPWNQFNIRLKNEDGSRRLRYEGNWRDIFQNWEALCCSFPQFLESVIGKFVNGSSVDGFNPYRVTSEGMEWEELDEEDPWSNIGYWGDHQIVYLLRLLQQLRAHQPSRLAELLSLEQFAYLQIPYRLKPFRELIKNPRDSIDFDHGLNKQIAARVAKEGEDGKLVRDTDGSIYHANLLEKLLVPALSKLSNFVPGGGIWMNTQRPEWNDANNALAGNGVSMVTLCYLRQYLQLLAEMTEESPAKSVAISREVHTWLTQIKAAFEAHRAMLDRADIANDERYRLLSALGQAFTDYRTLVYDNGFSGKTELSCAEVVAFCQLALAFIDQTVHLAARSDALYDAYKVLRFDSDQQLSVRPLYEMLEGQVATISSGALRSEEVIDLIDAMYLSRMYREDQHSFMLYPEKTLSDFIDRNVVPDNAVEQIPLLVELHAAGDESLICRDTLGVYRFAPALRRRGDVVAVLDSLATDPQWSEAVARDADAIGDLFERVFQHHTFTGRSGTMYGYEGIGCIYWHMVSKLLLAVQEQFFHAVDHEEPAAVQARLAARYYRIRRGLSFEKTPEVYGAFPTDPYSHTPKDRGAQQPGMTGQVKEEVLTRWGELGVRARDGQLTFQPCLLRPTEFLTEPGTFTYINLQGQETKLELSPGSLAFTYCQVPVIYKLGERSQLTLVTRSGDQTFAEPRLGREWSEAIWGRTGEVQSILVEVAPESLLTEDLETLETK